mgnify:FL=1
MSPTSAPVEEPIPPIVTTNNETGGPPAGDQSGNLPESMGGEDMNCGNYQGDGGLYAEAGLDAQSAEPEEIPEETVEADPVN